FIEESKTDDKWELARQYKLIDFVKWLTKQTGSKHTGVYFEGAGEGIQGNIYQIKGVRPFIFDVVVDDHFVSKKQMVEYVETFFGNRDLLAPILAEGVLFKDWLNNKTYADAADGKSMLFDTLREGYVVSLWDCVKTNPKLGRIILKFRSKEYLAKHDT
ncbi:MAG: hypothetical protein RLY43_1601, partial [Bacteroidota bacterium]